MVRNSKMILWFLALAVGACSFVPGVGLADEKTGSREFARENGVELLKAERWSEAAETLAVWPYELKQAVQSAWEIPPAKGEMDQGRFRYRLTHFFFDHMDFTWEGWTASAALIENYGTRYQEIVARNPPPMGAAVLDFSHLNLLSKIFAARNNNSMDRKDRDEIYTALKANAESIPAQAAYMIYMDSLNERDKWEEFVRAAEILANQRGKLNLARLIARCGRSSEQFKLAVSILADAWGLAPSNQEKARLLFALAEAQAGQKENLPRAGATAMQVYLFFPETQYAAEARALAASVLCQSGDIARAVELIRDLRKKGGIHQAGIDRALFDTAVQYYQKGDHDRSIALLEEVVKDFGATTTASRAMLGLAEVYAARKDKVKQREWLERCAKFDRTEPTARSIMDTDDTRSDAIQRLARFHEAEGQWQKALAWWKAWEPRSWCGTCRMQMRAERGQHIARCLVQMADHPAAAQFLLERLSDTQHDFDPLYATPLFQMYRAAGQLADLRRMVQGREEALFKEYEDKGYFKGQQREEAMRSLPTLPLQQLFRIRELGEKKDVAALIGFTQDANAVRCATFADDRDWRARAAAEALGECGDVAVAPIRERLAQGATNQSWLIYALGKNPTAAAQEVLLEFARREKGSDCDNVAYALTLHGDAGKKLLETIRDGDNSTMAATAKKWLEQPMIPAEPPRPRAGSLPKSLDP